MALATPDAHHVALSATGRQCHILKGLTEAMAQLPAPCCGPLRHAVRRVVPCPRVHSPSPLLSPPTQGSTRAYDGGLQGLRAPLSGARELRAQTWVRLSCANKPAAGLWPTSATSLRACCVWLCGLKEGAQHLLRMLPAVPPRRAGGGGRGRPRGGAGGGRAGEEGDLDAAEVPDDIYAGEQDDALRPAKPGLVRAHPHP